MFSDGHLERGTPSTPASIFDKSLPIRLPADTVDRDRRDSGRTSPSPGAWTQPLGQSRPRNVT